MTTAAVAEKTAKTASKNGKLDALRKPQVRILQVLAKLTPVESITRLQLADRAKVAKTAVVGLTGSATAEARASIETYHNYKSLITLGLAKAVESEVDGKTERTFAITAKGRALAAKLKTAK